MIAISGALVLVAAVLLVLGIVSSITLVYAAIGLSIVSAVLLLVGVFQRPPPAVVSRDSDGGDSGERESDAVADFPLEVAHADYEAQSGATGADVLVISGRPRYHAGGCEYVEGHGNSEPLEINEARDLGFTPCGICRPNETLARGAAGKNHADHLAPSPGPAATAASQPAPVTVASGPVEATPAPAAAAPAGRLQRAGRTVQAVAATKEYHLADCDLLEGRESEEVTKLVAIRQGYLACGVCKP